MKVSSFILMFSFLGVISLRGEELSAVVDNVQRTYEGIKDFKADFVQESTNKALKYTIRDTGVVYFKKPGKMRWDYFKVVDGKEILLQKIVNDGENIYFYNPADNQVIVEKLKSVIPSKVPGNFLSGMGNIKKDFDVVENYYGSEKKSKDLYYMELKPKEKIAGVNKIFIAVDREKYLVKETITVDPFENTTKIIFSNIERNKSIPDDVFKFQIPKGANVITPEKR
jgi:outer membrane lipoprotein carrier protein